MSGFEPRTYTKSEISAATGFAPPEVDQVADFLQIKRSQYREEHLASFQQFQAMMKENSWTVNQAIAAHRSETPSGKPTAAEAPSTVRNSALDETTGHINREGDKTALSTTDRRAIQIKQTAQRTAGEIETATNLLTTMYLATGNYDNPLVQQQVAQSEQLLEAQICSPSSTNNLGKLLAATGIPGLQTLPTIASAQKSLKLLIDGQH